MMMMASHAQFEVAVGRVAEDAQPPAPAHGHGAQSGPETRDDADAPSAGARKGHVLRVVGRHAVPEHQILIGLGGGTGFRRIQSASCALGSIDVSAILRQQDSAPFPDVEH